MITPARQQYLRMKAQHPDAVLLYRLGDFYEAFDEDAHTLAQVLGITLTSRSFGRAGRVPMAGIPHHALHGYLRRMLRAGLKVAIGEQVSEAGRGLVEREVVRVLSPGTLDDPALLDAGRPNYLLAVAQHGALYGLAWVDVSTGACEHHALPHDDPPALSALLTLLAPAETIAPASATPDPELFGHVRAVEIDVDIAGAESMFAQRFPNDDSPRPATLLALALLMTYLQRGHADLLGALETPLPFAAGRIMALDRQTRTNLELDMRQRGRPDLFGLLSATRTAPGARLLRAWLHRPLVDRAEIDQRLDAVEALRHDTPLRLSINKCLDGIRDLERLATRARTGGIRAQELHALADSLAHVEALHARITSTPLPRLLLDAACALEPLPKLRNAIQTTLDADGRLVRIGRDALLDGFYRARTSETDGLEQLARQERDRTGIRSLKCGYNKVFGYYFEVTRSHRAAVPADAERTQTLTNAERYTTPALRTLEARLNTLDVQITERETELYATLVGAVASELHRLRATAAAVATIDVLNALASVALEQRYVRPSLVESEVLEIHAGRHPIVERELPHGAFIPNDTHLSDGAHVVVLTGPNMAGKSTWLRQTALIVLLAQIGSFVPADAATIGVTDRIFTRIGAHDDLARGQSTFMVEMLETATILQHATAQSLVVLDEVGRGTSTEDGVALATAVVEYLAARVRARTLFATHFRELAHACAHVPGARAMQTAVTHELDQIVFLHSIVPGIADAALGLEIARLAGLPGEVLERARNVVQLDHAAPALDPTPTRGGTDLAHDRIFRDLLDVDIASTTPLQALVLLAEIQHRLREASMETLGPRALLAADERHTYGAGH